MKQRKYIFVIGGVLSSLGKGITAASLGRLLKDRGYKIMNQKLEPYLNFAAETNDLLKNAEKKLHEKGADLIVAVSLFLFLMLLCSAVHHNHRYL